MKKYILTFHEIMDEDFTAITLNGEDGKVFTNTDAEVLYANQKIEVELNDANLLFLINTLELNLL